MPPSPAHSSMRTGKHAHAWSRGSGTLGDPSHLLEDTCAGRRAQEALELPRSGLLLASLRQPGPRSTQPGWRARRRLRQTRAEPIERRMCPSLLPRLAADSNVLLSNLARVFVWIADPVRDERRRPMPQFPPPKEGFVLPHFIVPRDGERSRRFYTEVLGGELVLEGEPSMVALANGWVI